MINGMLTADEAAQRVGRAVHTLSNWRSLGIGPRFVRYRGRQPLYPVADLDEWIKAQIGESCPRCSSAGVIDRGGKTVACPDCKGNGRIA